jgi:hypothetical protein
MCDPQGCVRLSVESPFPSIPTICSVTVFIPSGDHRLVEKHIVSAKRVPTLVRSIRRRLKTQPHSLSTIQE